MTFVVADRVQENGTVSVGTGSVTLSGAVNGYQSFASGIGNNNTTYYTIYDPASYAWEVGLGTVTTGPNTLARTTVYANSAGTAPSKISFSTSNTLTVFVTYPAETAIYTGSSASLNSVTTTKSISSSTNMAPFNYGTLSYSDTGIFASYQTSVNSYAQMILQNSLNGTAASADYIVSSDGGTATTNYGDFGINSSAYTGTGPLNAASMVYLYSQSTDLTIGTNSSNAIHFTINNQATDAMTINTSGSIAINGQTGSLGQVLISQGSSNPPSWGNAGGNLVVTDFTATAGQTTFSVTYVVGTVSVYRNGIKLGLADFTATNGTSVVLSTGAVAGDLIEIQSFSTLTLYSAITSQDFSGTGSQTVFTLNTNPANSASLLVAINGVVQDPANYTISGNTLTFTTAPATGTNNISTRTLGVPATTAVSSFSAGTTGFSPTSAASGAVTLSGILNVANGGTGLTTLGSGYIPYGNGTSAFNSLSTFNFDGSTLFSPNASLSGNLTFSGTGSKILGDFTNTTLANRTVIQTSTTNGATGVYVVPNGTSTAASIQALNAATPTNASKILIATNGSTDVQLVSGINGSGTYLPLTFWNGGAEQMRLTTGGLLGIGTASPSATLTVGGTGIANATWTSSTRPGSPVAGQQGYNTTISDLEFWNGSAWTRVLNLNTPSTYAVTYLVVAAGGSGGTNGTGSGTPGGGGAGGYYSGTATVSSGTTYTASIGAGGAQVTTQNGNGFQGSNSSLIGGAISYTAIGGGYGAGAGGNAGGNGGSGGGGNNGTGGSGTTGQGNAGGAASGSGGGGAGSAGQSGSPSGNGGSGLQWVDNIYYAGGGGGGGPTSSNSNGGIGGGGAGGWTGSSQGTSTPGNAGAPNTGGGGGAGAYLPSGPGGSGIVAIAYISDAPRGQGGQVSSYTTGGVTYQIHYFTSSGTYIG